LATNGTDEIKGKNFINDFCQKKRNTIEEMEEKIDEAISHANGCHLCHNYWPKSFLEFHLLISRKKR